MSATPRKDSSARDQRALSDGDKAFTRERARANRGGLACPATLGGLWPRRRIRSIAETRSSPPLTI